MDFLKASEQCPCGSGKTYGLCCMKGQTRWYRDKTGRIAKFHLDCMPDQSKEHIHECDRGDHDCEHCEKNQGLEVILMVLTDEGDVVTCIDEDLLDAMLAKKIIAHIALVTAKVMKVYVDPTNDESQKGESVPLVMVGRMEDGISLGTAKEFRGVPTELLEKVFIHLDILRTEMMLYLNKEALSIGYDSVMGDMDRDDDDEDEDIE